MKLIQFTPDWQPPISADRPLPAVKSTDKSLSIPVLIAEDDPVSRKLVTAVVEMAGFRTIIAHDGAEAMSALRAQEGPCVAVLDWMMPEMDGAEICRRVRDAGRNVYIIMLTARSGKADTVEGLQGGADDYVSKPFDRHELLARIRVGVRVLEAQSLLHDRVQEFEQSVFELQPHKFQMPL